MTLATQTQLRRGTATQNDSLTGAAGEVTIDTTNNRPRLHDAAKAGGWHIPNHADVQNAAMKSGTAGGTANALTLTLAPVPAAYAAQMEIQFKAAADNTASATINVNGLGAKTLKKNVAGTLTDLAAGDIKNGIIYKAVYDGTYFQVRVDAASGLASVSQGNLNTSTGSVSVGGVGNTSANFSHLVSMGTMPGGQYAFGFESKMNTASSASFVVMGNSSTSFIRTAYAIHLDTNNRTKTAQERYVTASPPFDLGDGELAGFIFARVNRAGDIVGTYIADVPPWAYNGPTRIVADRICPLTRKKYGFPHLPFNLDELMMVPEEHLRRTWKEREITQEIKNADMHLIPHPFLEAIQPDETVVLLNPRDDAVRRLILGHNAGMADEIVEALHSGKIYADNEFLSGMKGPPGVAIAPLRFKYSR